MTISARDRRTVRQRAGYACEYCGISEVDVGGELTVDHFRPRMHGGADALENLLYSCHRCNQYKAGYWPATPDDLPLWNPRLDVRSEHMVEIADGTLSSVTAIGEFTVHRLRLNRPPLVAHRRRLRAQGEVHRLTEQYREAVALTEQLQRYQIMMLEEQRLLLDELRALLLLLLGRTESP